MDQEQGELLVARMEALELRMAHLAQAQEAQTLQAATTNQNMNALVEQMRVANVNAGKVFAELVRTHKSSIPIWSVAAMFGILLLVLGGKETIEWFFKKELIQKAVTRAINP